MYFICRDSEWGGGFGLSSCHCEMVMEVVALIVAEENASYESRKDKRVRANGV